MGRQGGWARVGTGTKGAHTSLTRGLKLSWVAVLPVAGYCAGADLDHIAGIGPQPIQLHRVLLAGHSGGNALVLQCQGQAAPSGLSSGQPGSPTPRPPPAPLTRRRYSHRSPGLSGGHPKVTPAC